jgi:exopolyphosphatase/guanosine-5'-triphosphate,3'-diphosphate pyrophosphatase
VRVVGTNTFRKAKAADFFRNAENALGKTIHVVSGHEEARLVYRGVSFSNQDLGSRLVVDIGGGSTELILGTEDAIEELASHYCGCVSSTLRYFPDGILNAERFEAATMAARREIGNDVRRYRDRFDVALGSSGSINAIERLITSEGMSEEGITLDSLDRLQEAFCAAGKIEAVAFDVISEERKEVLAGAIAILKGVFQALGVERMQAVSTALREGILLDLWGRKHDRDVRSDTVSAMQERFEVDVAQAARVQHTALDFFDQISESLGIPAHPFRNWLRYSSALHEIGLFLGFSGYHKHGAYLLAKGELPGFSWQEQRALAALVMGHRGKFEPARLHGLSPGRELPLELVLLLRVARRLHRRRSPRRLPSIRVTGTPGDLHFKFPAKWLRERPLTVADLEKESALAEGQNIRLRFR